MHVPLESHWQSDVDTDKQCVLMLLRKMNEAASVYVLSETHRYSTRTAPSFLHHPSARWHIHAGWVLIDGRKSISHTAPI